MKQAVILAAGRGMRLNGACNGTPKCLIEVGGRTLIERQLDALSEVGIERACVVVGYKGDDVRAAVGHRCHVINNDRYMETNSLYSLWLARKWVEGSFVLLNCDVLAHPDVYHRVLAVNGSALAYDSSSGGEPEHMKVQIENRLVRAMSKQLPPERVSGENVGILQFDREGAAAVLAEANVLVQGDADAEWAPTAVASAAEKTQIRAVDIADLPWTEIDFPDDLSGARGRVWPLIELGRWVADAVHPHDAAEPVVRL